MATAGLCLLGAGTLILLGVLIALLRGSPARRERGRTSLALSLMGFTLGAISVIFFALNR